VICTGREGGGGWWLWRGGPYSPPVLAVPCAAARPRDCGANRGRTARVRRKACGAKRAAQARAATDSVRRRPRSFAPSPPRPWFWTVSLSLVRLCRPGRLPSCLAARLSVCPSVGKSASRSSSVAAFTLSLSRSLRTCGRRARGGRPRSGG
jgi:hypothetical protein